MVFVVTVDGSATLKKPLILKLHLGAVHYRNEAQINPDGTISWGDFYFNRWEEFNELEASVLVKKLARTAVLGKVSIAKPKLDLNDPDTRIIQTRKKSIVSCVYAISVSKDAKLFLKIDQELQTDRLKDMEGPSGALQRPLFDSLRPSQQGAVGSWSVDVDFDIGDDGRAILKMELVPADGKDATAQTSTPTPAPIFWRQDPRIFRVRFPDELHDKDFEYIYILGKGSFGRVIQVRYKPRESIGEPKLSSKYELPAEPGMHMAMKVVDKEEGKSSSQMYEEVYILRELRGHPFIVQLTASWYSSSKKMLIMVMELCTGGTLSDLAGTWKKILKKDDKKKDKYAAIREKVLDISWRERIVTTWAAEIAMALRDLHRLHIVYRDLKPNNILLDRNGHIRLCDLGIAFKMTEEQTAKRSEKIQQHKEDISNKVRTSREAFTKKKFGASFRWASSSNIEGKQKKPEPKESSNKDSSKKKDKTKDLPTYIIGGDGWKAPEMLKGEGYGFEIDWWSFGVLLYYLISGGKHPFDSYIKAFTNRDRNAAKTTGKMKEIKGLSTKAASLLEGLLQPDPNQRLGSYSLDAEEILTHPFFADVDWSALIEKRLNQEHVFDGEDVGLSKPLKEGDVKSEFESLKAAIEDIDRQDIRLQLGLQAGIM